MCVHTKTASFFLKINCHTLRDPRGQIVRSAEDIQSAIGYIVDCAVSNTRFYGACGIHFSPLPLLYVGLETIIPGILLRRMILLTSRRAGGNPQSVRDTAVCLLWFKTSLKPERK